MEGVGRKLPVGKRYHWIVCLERSLGQDIQEVGLAWARAVCSHLRDADDG